MEYVGVKILFFFFLTVQLPADGLCATFVCFQSTVPHRRLFTSRLVPFGKSRLSHRLAANVPVFAVSLGFVFSFFLPSCCAQRCAHFSLLIQARLKQAQEFTLLLVCTN